MLKNVVGLFGVCGSSTWRPPVITYLSSLGVPWYNPQVEQWSPELATVEAENLATNKVIFMVINGEMPGFGSLAEVGFALRSAEKNGQTLVLVLEDVPNDHPQGVVANRTRALVRAHAKEAGLTVYGSVEEAIDVVISAMEV